MTIRTAKAATRWRYEVNTEINTVLFRLWNNNAEAFMPKYDLRVDYSKLDPTIAKLPEKVRYMVGLGIKNSVQDAGSAAKTNDERLKEMRERAEYIEAGAPDGWTRRGSGGRRPGDLTLLWKVLERMFAGKDVGEMISRLQAEAEKQGKTWEAAMAAFLVAPAVKPTTDLIREEMNAAKAKDVDATALLAALGVVSEDGDEDEADESEAEEA